MILPKYVAAEDITEYQFWLAWQAALTRFGCVIRPAGQVRFWWQRLICSKRLTPKGAQTNLGDKLSQWWWLPNFEAFQAEVVKRFKADIPLRQRNDWQALFEQEKTRIQQLSANFAAAERSIDSIVYALFDLSAAEIMLIKRAVQL